VAFEGQPMTSVLLVDDSPVILKAVRAMLLHHPDINVIGAVLTLGEAIRANEEFHPNVTVLDLSMTEGVEAKRQADELVGNSKTVVLMSLLPDHDMKPLLAAIGVASCIDKMDLYTELPKFIREANLVASSC
jgi:DNA-binding NarL/FixJ family response regulator